MKSSGIVLYIENSFSGLPDLPWVVFDGTGTHLGACANRKLAEALKATVEDDPCLYY